jgi:hypothetical protein
MALSIKELIEKNKKAYSQHFYIESVFLSQSLTTKALRQIAAEEKIQLSGIKPKLSDCLKALKLEYKKRPAFKSKLKKTLYNNICEFNKDYKNANKELKYQYPELKLKHTAKRGIEVVASLHTTLIKLKANRAKI